MPIALICGACEAKLTAPDAAAGKKVKCRQCGVILEIPFPEPEPEADFEIVEDEPAPKPAAPKPAAPKPAAKAPPPAAAPLAKAKPKPAMLEVADDDDDEPLPVKKKSKPVVVADDDEHDRPVKPKKKPVVLADDEEDEDFKPTKKPGKKAAIVEDDDEDYDDAPKAKKGKKGKGKAKKAGSNLPLLIGGGVLGLALVGFLVYWFAIRTPDVAKGPGPTPNSNGLNGLVDPQTGGPPAGWEVVTKPDFTAWMLAGDLQEPPIPPPPTLAGLKAYAKMQTKPEGAQMVMVMRLKPADVAAARTNPRAVVDKLLAAGGPTKGQLVARTDATVGGKPGESLHYRDGKDDVYMRAAIDGDRAFLLIGGGDGLNDQSDRVKLFFNNFQILPGGANPIPSGPNPGPAGKTPAGWKEFAGDGFTVPVPSGVEMSRSAQAEQMLAAQAPGSKAWMNTTPPVVFQVLLVKLKANEVAEFARDPEAGLRNAAKGSQAGLPPGTKVEKEATITAGGRTWRQFVLRMPNQADSVMRLTVHDGMLVTQSAIAQNLTSDADNRVKPFFESFRFAGK